MGISGLLPFLKDAIEVVNLKQLEGCVVAVDTYCWIYKGAFSCAEQLALGQPADGHIKFVLKYVNKLLEHNIKPIMVFDGCCLPSKKQTEAKRRESKEMNRKKAAQCLLDGKRNEARECFQRCIEVTQKMAHEVIKAVHDLGVDVIVAPYEADAQLAYLSKTNIAHIIITEDSDLILFGCKRVLYKLDLNGTGNLLNKEKIDSITQFDIGDKFERFRWMCILSGCDYLENLPGIGLGKAKKLLRQTRKLEIEAILKAMPQNLKMSSLVITQEYIENFKKADKTFKYQIVFDPIKRQLIPLHEYGSDIIENENVSYAGYFYDNDLANQLALGNLNVNDKTPVDDFDPEKWKYKPPYRYMKNPPTYMRSIWSMNFTPQEIPIKLFNSENENVLKEVNRASTKGVEKSMSTSCLIQKNKLNASLASSPTAGSPTVSKRKYNENKVDESTPQQKKFKSEEIRVDIDNLINDYTLNVSDADAEEETNVTQSSAYFSSSNQMSPVLTRSSQKSSNSQVSSTSETMMSISQTTSKSDITLVNSRTTTSTTTKSKTPFKIKTENVVVEESVSTLETKLSISGYRGSELKQSPLVLEKKSTSFLNPQETPARKDISNFFDSFAKKPTSIHKKLKPSDENHDEAITVSSQEEPPEEKAEDVKKKSIINDIDSIESKPAAASAKATAKKVLASNKNKTNSGKPISDYFIKFEYKKINENNKFVHN